MGSAVKFVVTKTVGQSPYLERDVKKVWDLWPQKAAKGVKNRCQHIESYVLNKYQ
jgi:hypothetical protein